MIYLITGSLIHYLYVIAWLVSMELCMILLTWLITTYHVIKSSCLTTPWCELSCNAGWESFMDPYHRRIILLHLPSDFISCPQPQQSFSLLVIVHELISNYFNSTFHIFHDYLLPLSLSTIIISMNYLVLIISLNLPG